jgi:hypothetical protein
MRALVPRKTDGGNTMDATTCPECAAPAEVTDRFALESTEGPIEHVRLQCVRRHWFLMPTATLATHRGRPASSAPPTRVDRPVRRRH